MLTNASMLHEFKSNMFAIFVLFKGKQKKSIKKVFNVFASSINIKIGRNFAHRINKSSK